jgi:hypothetical protein
MVSACERQRKNVDDKRVEEQGKGIEYLSTSPASGFKSGSG